MIDLEQIQEIATKEQTLAVNITREYCQHLFLSYFYRNEDAGGYLFKGGTALRIAFQSPRYSEDLDFSANKVYNFNKLLERTAEQIRAENISAHIILSTQTTGGYLAKMQFSFPFTTENPEIKFNVQLKQEQLVAKSTIIQNKYLPPYPIQYLDDSDLIREKIEAFRSRVKARDFFDLYFMFTHEILRGYAVKYAKGIKQNILDELDRLDDRELKNELRQFLPVNYHNLLQGDGFRSNLRNQIEKNIPNIY